MGKGEHSWETEEDFVIAQIKGDGDLRQRQRE